MAPNPNPNRITNELWRFWEEFKALEPTVLLGGIFANKPGYHNTRNNNNPTNYSVREAEDKGGPGDKAAAIDLTFPDAQRRDYRTIARYCQRLMASSIDRNDPRLDGMREWYGQTDSDAYVEGRDCRHLIDITSDESHLFHIHLSFDRDKVTSWPMFDAVLSVLKGESLEAWRNRATSAPAPVPAPPVPPPPLGLPFHKNGRRVLKLINPNMRGTDVRFVQRWIGPQWAGAPDGMFGPATKAGVIKYQRMRGLTPDGEVGPKTWRAMGIR